MGQLNEERELKGTVRRKSGGGHGGEERREMWRKPSDRHLAAAVRLASAPGK